ncbi:MAG TPA: TAXI family TRAP transporter solute-binding subunit [Geminicoccaceae bacterium]|nr:TAXI family TRAP transporter solute-binding subunit [Geminicoccaceae bacterium]
MMETRRGTILAAAGLMMIGLAAAPPAGAQDRTGWPDVIRIGTASAGGTYAVYGAGLAGLLQERLQIEADPRNTGGPVQNMLMVHQGELDLGMTTMGPALESWEGRNPLMSGVETRDVRATFPMYQTPFQVVALADSGIASLDDLAGKRVGVGPIEGTSATYWPVFFETLGIEEVRPVFGGANELATQLRFRVIRAFAFSGGFPIPAFVELERDQPVNMFALTAEQQAKLVASFPVSAFEIPANVYASVAAPQPTVAMWNFGIANKDVPESLVYEVMKVVLDGNAQMVSIHEAARETLAENWVHNTFMWFHPGAVRYYRERGIEIPPELLPPEARQ